MTSFSVTTDDGVFTSIEDFRARYEVEFKDPSRLSRRYAATIDMIAALAPAEGGAWLDYGTGWGDFAWHLARRLPRWQIVGLDGDAICQRIANNLFAAPNVSFRFQDYGSFDGIAAETYDGLSLLEVLEHHASPMELLAACRRALKPGGLLVLSTPNAFGWRYVNHELRRRLNKMTGRRGDAGYLAMLRGTPYDPVTERGHVVTHNMETLERLLRVAGFEVTSFAYVAVDGRPVHRLFPDTLLLAARRSPA